MDTAKFLRRLASGDKTAFAPIYAATNKTVYYIALSILGEKELAEDASQSAYLKIIESAHSFSGKGSAEGWIYSVAKNTALNMKKKASRETAVDFTQTDISGSVEQSGYNLLIDLARSTLSQDEFEILIYSAVGGYKRREIAKITNMPVSTVSWKYSCAVKKLRQILKEE